MTREEERVLEELYKDVQKLIDTVNQCNNTIDELNEENAFLADFIMKKGLGKECVEYKEKMENKGPMENKEPIIEEPKKVEKPEVVIDKNASLDDIIKSFRDS